MAGVTVQKASVIERAIGKFGAWFEEKGLSSRDLPAAIVFHELIGISMAIGFWTLCYAVQPGKTLARPLFLQSGRRGHIALGKLQETYGMAIARASASVQRLPKFLRKDSARLTVSLAESLCLRAAIKPLTFPFKLWASYQVVVLMKKGGWKGKEHGGGGGGGGDKKGRRREPLG